MSQNTAAQSPDRVAITFAEFPPGTPVTLVTTGGSEPLFLGGITYGDRPPDFPPGSSSPQWVQKIVVGTDQIKMKNGDGVDATLGQPRVRFTSCTGSSKQVQLFRIDANGVTTFMAGVEVLATQGDYDLEANPPKHTINGLVASQAPIDPNAGLPVTTQLARAWRTMSALSEALFLNYPKP
jgi:hypothetical protein